MATSPKYAPQKTLDSVLVNISDWYDQSAKNILDASHWVSSREIERIEVVVEYAGTQRLKPIYDALHGQVDYDSIRIVLACRANRLKNSLP